MTPQYEIEHIAIAVRSIKKAFEFYRALGWTEPTIEEVPSEKVRVGFISFLNNVHIELLEATSDDSPVAKFIEKRGEGIHHICVRTKSIDQDLKVLKEKGFRLVNETAKPGAKGCYVAFVHPASTSGTLLELSEERHGV
ncbi:MAG: methylmalonyl-CoA epimerase [Bdellovibrionales bacterium]